MSMKRSLGWLAREYCSNVAPEILSASEGLVPEPDMDTPPPPPLLLLSCEAIKRGQALRHIPLGTDAPSDPDRPHPARSLGAALLWLYPDLEPSAPPRALSALSALFFSIYVSS